MTRFKIKNYLYMKISLSGNKVFSSFFILVLFLVTINYASAHAVVRPAQIGIGAYQEFTLSVPSEKPLATVAIKMLIPDEINSVTPNVKQGWKVEVKSQKTGQQVKDDDGMMMDQAKVSEIDWTGGSIPASQRDTFSFQIQTPTKATTLNWKVYQTYSDGSVISWDKDSVSQPKDANGKAGFSSFGPYSSTKIVDDLSSTSTSPAQVSMSSTSSQNADRLPIVVSVVALALSSWTLFKKRL
jgi:uncharacterized protein YcnI